MPATVFRHCGSYFFTITSFPPQYFVFRICSRILGPGRDLLGNVCCSVRLSHIGRPLLSPPKFYYCLDLPRVRFHPQAKNKVRMEVLPQELFQLLLLQLQISELESAQDSNGLCSQRDKQQTLYMQPSRESTRNQEDSP